MKKPKIKIDKGIPIPERRGGGRPFLYPWHIMDVGDSFIYLGNLPSGRQSASRAGRNSTKKFQVRYVDGAVRIWRTA